MKKHLLSLALVCFGIGAQAQEVNQYGQQVDSKPVQTTVQDGILVFQNKE